MGSLAKTRVSSTARPFVLSDVDVCYPYFLKEGSRNAERLKNVHIAIFCVSPLLRPTGSSRPFEETNANVKRLIQDRSLVFDYLSFSNIFFYNVA